MAALVGVETVAIVLLIVLVAGLLRSHADILRALHALGVDLETPPDHSQPVALQTGGSQQASRPRVAVADVAGVNPAGDALGLAIEGVAHDTLLAFLTTGCATCHDFWRTFGADPPPVPPGGARLVVVVHDPGEESISKVRDLAPDGLPVVMSSQAWEDYDVRFAPYFIYVSGALGRIVGEGSAASWEQVVSLAEQAGADTGASARPVTSTRARPGNGDDAREGRADAELMGAGVLPGDPRLYPTAPDGSRNDH
jgi:hypothetical protein